MSGGAVVAVVVMEGSTEEVDPSDENASVSSSGVLSSEILSSEVLSSGVLSMVVEEASEADGSGTSVVSMSDPE